MPSTNLTLSDNETLAEYVPAEAFTGLLQNRIGISPDHAALLMRDGRIVDVFIGAHFAIGGVWQRLKEAIGGPHAVRLLVADLKPFQIEGKIEGVSKDSVAVTATVAIEFQVNPEKAANILGLMPEHGALTKPDVYARVLPHLNERVFRTVLTQVCAADIRGNTPLQDKIQSQVFLEVQRLFQDVGLLVRSVTLTWALNDVERAAMQKSESERAQALLDYQFACKKREIEREKEATEFQLRTDVDVEKLKAASEDELRHMVLDQELAFVDARQAGIREQELKTLESEINVLNVQRRAIYEKALEDAQNEVDRTQISVKLTELQLQIADMKERQRLAHARLKDEQDIAIAAQIRRGQTQSIEEMTAIDLRTQATTAQIRRDDRAAEAQIALQAAQQASQAEVVRYAAAAPLSQDQILAINAGLSPDVARIFVERAKVMSIDVDKREALLKEMVQLTTQGRMASEEQARFFFEHAMQPAAVPRTAARPAGDAEDTVECPQCHARPRRADRFCRRCGHEMRA
jgi:hypothetical protein